MQEIFAHFPTPPDQPSIIEGQIFALRYNPIQPVAASPKEYQAVPPTEGITQLQAKLLAELSVYHHATADLLLRKLGLSPNSYRHVQKQLQSLHAKEPEDRFVEIIVPPKRDDSRFGSAPYVYTLGRQGYKYLRKQGFAIGRFRQLDAGVHEPFPLRHRLAVNEFLLKAQLLEAEHKNVQLRDYQHEKYWNANPLKVRIPDAERAMGISPDLSLTFDTFAPADEYRFLVEINLSEMWRRDWEAKVTAYRYSMPAYKDRVGTDILTTIPVMIVSSSAFPRRVHPTLSEEEQTERQLEAQRRQKRLATILHWTEVTLERLNMSHEADLFSFSAAPLPELTPTELFYSRHWIHPFSDTPHPLILAREEGER